MESFPEAAECCVIGGGAVGCSVAYHLAARGVKVALLERSDIGSGSTAKCAGGVRQQFSTEVNVKVGMLSRRLLDRFERDTGMTPAFKEIGYLFLATSEEELARFDDQVAMQRTLGLSEVRMLTKREISSRLPELRTDDVVGGTFCPTDGIAGPNEMTMGYIHAAKKLGAIIVEECAVMGISGRAGDFRVETARGPVRAERIVNCAGPYAAGIGAMLGVDVPVKPSRRHIFLTTPVKVPAGMPMVVDFATTFYCHPEGEGILLGMSDPNEKDSFDTTINWEFLPAVVERAAWRLPFLADAEIATGWAGLYEITPDFHAIVGESQVAGFWLCCGFSGHGFMQAPAIGQLLGEAMSGVTPSIDLSPFDPGRFSRNELHQETAVI